LVSLIERESTSKCCVYFVRSNTLLLCISLLGIYLLYRTDPQTHRLDRFLKVPELSGQVGISRIPSKNTDRKITNLSTKHSFTHSVSYTCCAWAGGTFFLVVLLCQFLVLAGNSFGFTYLRT
jgi:hypothetical protein